MKIQYEVRPGVVLSASELAKCQEYYQAACTAEYIQENFDVDLSGEKEALRLGHAVRQDMDKYGRSEEESIQVVLLNKGW